MAVRRVSTDSGLESLTKKPRAERADARPFPADAAPRSSHTRIPDPLRAYQLYEAGGREDGHELEDWFRAKEEITIKKFRTATA
jgi:hypothetical protein